VEGVLSLTERVALGFSGGGALRPLIHLRQCTWFRRQHGSMARKFLGVTATSVASERVFSKTGYIVSDRRALLKLNEVQQLTFLNNNNNNNNNQTYKAPYTKLQRRWNCNWDIWIMFMQSDGKLRTDWLINEPIIVTQVPFVDFITH